MYNLYKGVAYPWLCDMMGHMNNRHFVAMFDDASYHLLSEATGWSFNSQDWQDKGWADVKHEVEFKHEILAGTLVEVNGGIIEIGKSSVTSQYHLENKMTGELAAQMTAKIVLFDLKARTSIPISGVMREKMKARLLQR